MPRETALERRRRLATISGVTYNSYDFRHICRKKPNRVGIIAEGDSWFAYPRKWIAAGGDINIIHHIADKIEGTDTANLLRLASNGDEAVEMTSGKQFRRLNNIISTNKDWINVVLFSGGGNDIVGKDDMLPILNEYTNGMNYMDCIRLDRFKRKIDAIILAYQRLVDLCTDEVPTAKIFTHTYDIAKPWDQGAEFFWGLIKTKPWIYPYMVERGIPRDLHLPIIDYMLKNFAENLMSLAQKRENKDRLIVIDTQGTLRPGSTVDWINEIHPTESGFKKVTQKIYKAVRDFQPSLPR